MDFLKTKAVRVMIINPSGEEDRGVLNDVLKEAKAKVEEFTTQEAVDLLDPGPPAQNARIVSSLPKTSAGSDCLILLGSPLGVHTGPPGESPQTPPELTKEMEALVHDFHAHEKPVLGICLGSQVITRSFGGKVYPLPRDSEHTALPLLEKPQPAVGTEFGFHMQEFTPEAKTDAVVGPALQEWQSARPSTQANAVPKFMQWHSDTFDFPPGAVPLSTSPACPNQAFRIGKSTYAFQYHIEVGNKLAEEWYKEYAEGTATHASCGSEEPEKIDQAATKAHLASIMAEGAVDRAEAFTKSIMRTLLKQALLLRESKTQRCSAPASCAIGAAFAAVVASVLLRKAFVR